MKKLYLLLVLASVLVFPSAAHAAWWNPFTWSWGASDGVDVPPQAIQEGTPGADLPPLTDAPATPSKIETVVETRYVDDPKLAAQITALTQDNKELSQNALDLTNQVAALKATNAALTRSVNSCKSDNEDLNAIIRANTSSSASADASTESKSDAFTAVDNRALAFTSAITHSAQVYNTDILHIPIADISSRIPEANAIIDAYKTLDPNFGGRKIDANQPGVNQQFSDLISYFATYISYHQ